MMALSKLIDQILPDDLCAKAHDRACHHAFLLRALALPISAALSAPLLVAMKGALPLWQNAALVSCLLPLSAVFFMQHKHFVAAHVSLVGAWLALATSLAMGIGLSLAACACLLLAVCETVWLKAGRHIIFALVALVSLALVLLARASVMTIADGVIGVAAGLYLAHMLAQMRAELSRQDESAAQAHHHHAALENVLGDVRLYFTRAGAVLSVDPSLREKWALTPRDLSGRGFFERVPLADRPALIKALGDAAQSHSVQTLCLNFHLRDEESPRARFVTPIYVAMDMRLVALSTDEILALVREADPASLAARPAPVELDQRLAHISHELRTPLNAMIGFSELLATRHDALDEARRRAYAQIIYNSSQHVLDLANAFLDMSQMESGAFPVAPEPFVFADLIDECCDMMMLKAQDSGLALHRQIQRDAAEIVADRRACKQILLNLLSNAIKFTPAGGVVTVHAQQSGQDLLLAVRDTGIGIASEDLPRLGDPFFQAQVAPKQSAEGTGLGLSLVKGLVGLHGGAIAIESALAQGTCVTIRLPMDCRPYDTGVATPAIIHSVPHPRAGSQSDLLMVKKIA